MRGSLLAYAAALIRDVRPRCTAIAQAGAPPVIYTVCAAHVGQNTLDLGTILITEGRAFAATDGNGKPIKFDYAVAEREAQKAHGAYGLRPIFRTQPKFSSTPRDRRLTPKRGRATMEVDAQAIAKLLGGRREGAGYLCHCPVKGHGKGRGDRRPSLGVSDGDKALVVHCFAG